VTLDVLETDETKYKWVKINLKNQAGILKVIKVSDSTATKCYIYNSDYELLQTEDFVWDEAEFNITALRQWEDYYILTGNDFWTYNSYRQTGSASFDYELNNIDIVWWQETLLEEIAWWTHRKEFASLWWQKIVFQANRDCLLWDFSAPEAIVGDAILYKNWVFYKQAISWTNFWWVKLDSWNEYSIGYTPTREYVPYGNNPSTVSWTNISITSLPSIWRPLTYLSDVKINTYTLEDNNNLNNIENITTNESLLINEWTKAHIVLAQEWDEVDPARYFKVGHSTNNTTTRGFKTYNWSDWEYWYSYYSDNSQQNLNTTWTLNISCWYRIQDKSDSLVYSVTKHNSCTATRVLLKSDAWAILASATFIWNVAKFTTPYQLSSWTFYRIEADGSGSDYTTVRNTQVVFPITWKFIDFNIGSINWNNNVQATNIVSIEFLYIDDNSSFFLYTSSDLFANELLSKTDATYSYKLPNDIPRFAKSNWAIGEKVKCSYLGIADLFTGLTEWSDYYLQDIPWAIGATAGTNTYWIWKAINSTKLFIKDILSGSI
jgi:hypothetical protein